MNIPEEDELCVYCGQDKKRISELEGQLCRAREACEELCSQAFVDEERTRFIIPPAFEQAVRLAKQALSSPSPCRHEEEKKEVIGEAKFWHKEHEELKQENATLREDIKDKERYGHEMDALAEERLMEITRLRELNQKLIDTEVAINEDNDRLREAINDVRGIEDAIWEASCSSRRNGRGQAASDYIRRRAGMEEKK